MTKVSMKAITTGVLLVTSSLAAAHSASHTEMAPLHFLTSLDHLLVFALVAAGAIALFARRTVTHLRKATSGK